MNNKNVRILAHAMRLIKIYSPKVLDYFFVKYDTLKIELAYFFSENS